MELVPISSLVVITLLQLCRAQSSNSTPEWYAANDINDTNFSPKPITELFSTETSFSPEEPIIVLSSIPANRGIVSSPTPIIQYSDSTDSPPPSNVIPLSSTELPTSSLLPETIAGDSQSPQRPSTTPQIASTEPTITPNLPNQAPGQLPRNNVLQNPQQNQPSIPSNRLPPQPTPPRNIQFLLPPQMGNRIFQGQQVPSNGQPNVFVLYEQVPQNIFNIPPPNSPVPPQSPGFPSQPLMPLRGSQQPTVVRVPNTIQRPQMSNQFFPQPNALPPSNVPLNPNNIVIFPQPNALPPSNIPPTLNNLISTSQSNNLQQGGLTPINPPPNNNQQINNQTSNIPAIVNQNTNIQQPPIQYQQPINQMSIPPKVQNIARRRPLQQRYRVDGGKTNRRRLNTMQAPNQFPCQGSNTTAISPSTAKNTQNPVITIRLTGSQNSRSDQINRNPTSTTGPSTVRPRQSSQANTRNYERCLNSCRDKKDRICAGPEGNIEINPNTLKGFPSMCHMACHNTFRANPIYERITNGRCGKLRTRIQTVEKTKVRRDELKKSQYTIISNVPGTIVELAP